MTIKSTNYVVITPVRDEEAHIRSTVESMVKQTVLPKEWVIVNDGSKDRTGQIIDDYACRFPWIKTVHRQDRGFRKSGGGVVEAFNEGYRASTCTDWEYIVKFDGDLRFDANYFEKCFEEFNYDSELGVGGGVICYLSEGKKTFEKAPRFHVRGATKIYRKACWDGIGGFISAPGWDSMDEIKANSLGWTTRSFPQLHLVHERVTGSADGQWSTLIKYGRANYICGYHPLFMMSKCVVRLAQRPFLIGSIGLMYGFLSGYLLRIRRSDDRAAIAYLRNQQIRRLLGRESIWR
jgi:glycosyltransferase involved in cell wall biosynthesis